MRVPARLRTIFVCSMLEFAVLFGLPMRPEQIDALMRTMNQPKLAHVITEEKGDQKNNPAVLRSGCWVLGARFWILGFWVRRIGTWDPNQNVEPERRTGTRNPEPEPQNPAPQNPEPVICICRMCHAQTDG